ncbi:MAG: uridine kinase [Gemmatimonadota bacterium]|jgi:uridine kinase|nr:uridine kinase [Gemmatimonadota bacterium]
MRPLIIGVAGGSGSGKTTVAMAIHARLGVDAVFLDQDAYYADLGHLPLEERIRTNFDHPDALDTDLMVAHLEALAMGRPIDKPTYDFAQHTRAPGTIRVEPRDVILVDGILIFADARLRRLFDVKVFVDVADDLRFIRRMQRDVSERGRSVDSVIAQYLGTVRPMHLEFVEPSKRHADIIVPEGGRNTIAIQMLEARVAAEIARRRDPQR